MTRTANCTCRICGSAFTKDLSEYGAGASKRLREKIEWAENGGIDLCPDCYKAQKREAEKAEGLTCHIRLGSAFDRDIKAWAVFGGDSYSHKDELKAAGARYTDEYPSKSALSDILGIERTPRAWCLCDTSVEPLLAKAEALGAKIYLPSETDLAVWQAARQTALQAREEKAAEAAANEQEKQAALSELGEKPAWPQSVSDKWPKGAKWNTRIYGKPGNHRIYLSGKEIHITDEEAAAMQDTLKARESWTARKKEIEAQYGA